MTDDGFFRLIMTLFGIVVTDCWKGYSFHLPTNHRHKGLEIEELTRLLAQDLLENTFPNDQVSEERALTIMETDNNNQTGQVPSTINALAPAEADALTTLSTLSKSVSSGELESYTVVVSAQPDNWLQYVVGIKICMSTLLVLNNNECIEEEPTVRHGTELFLKAALNYHYSASVFTKKASSTVTS